jgi:uncharacterized protein (TIGR03435 family)
MLQLRSKPCRLWIVEQLPPILHRTALGILAVGLLVASHAIAQASPPISVSVQPSLEVATIKPSRPDDRGRKLHPSADRIAIENFTLKELIAYAYNLKDNSQVLGGPDWLDKAHFDLAGVAGEAEIAKLRSMSADDRRKEWGMILQPLLADRFRLKVSLGERTMPVYVLIVAKSGPKLTSAAASDKGQSTSWGDQRMTWTATSMDNLAYYLTRVEGRVVLDRTGLVGLYDFTLNWSWGEDPSSQAYGADLLTALREQLGLELKPAKAPVDVVIVQSASEPSVD